MIALYDDYYLISQACRIVIEKPFYRILHSQTACLLGQNVDYVRIFSLLILLVAAFIFVKSIVTDQRDLIRQYLFIGLNSAYLVGFYYSSLLSMSFAVLWCSLFIYFYKKESLRYSVPLGLLAFLIRKEVYFYILIFIVFDLFRTRFLQNIDYKKYLTQKKIKFFILSFLAYTLIDLIIYFFFDYRNQLSNFYSNNGQYPENSRLAVQIWAALLYLKNIILPHTMSFYGNFMDWFWIHQNKLIQAVLWGGLVTLFTFGTYSFFKIKNGFNKYLLTGISFFIVSVFLLSSLPRTDWYYTTRQIIPSIWLLTFIFDYFKKIKLGSILINISIIYFLASIFFHIFYHYSSYERFYYYETQFNEKSHPYVYEMYAGKLSVAKHEEKALEVLRRGFTTITQESLAASNRTYYYWIRNVYNAFVLGKKVKDESVIKNSYRILLLNKDFYSLIACLQVHVDHNECRQFFSWKDKFCKISDNNSPRYDLTVVYTPAVISFTEEFCKNKEEL